MSSMCSEQWLASSIWCPIGVWILIFDVHLCERRWALWWGCKLEVGKQLFWKNIDISSRLQPFTAFIIIPQQCHPWLTAAVLITSLVVNEQTPWVFSVFLCLQAKPQHHVAVPKCTGKTDTDPPALTLKVGN